MHIDMLIYANLSTKPPENKKIIQRRETSLIKDRFRHLHVCKYNNCTVFIILVSLISHFSGIMSQF